MLNFSKHALLIVGTLSANISGVWADFDQVILDRAMSMASKDYKIGKNPVNQAVQAANFLAHELRLESNPERAQNIADTLFALVNEGRGAGGISETPANEGERPLMIGALEAATHFLKNQKNLPEKLKTSAAAAKAHERQHLNQVREIVLGALKAGAREQAYNAAIQKEINELRESEEKNDGGIDYRRKDSVQKYIDSLVHETDPLKNLQILTDTLTKTVILEKAFQISEKAREILKKIDFSDVDHVRPEFINALIAIEKYRMFETKQGDLGNTDPTIFDYQGTAQSPESEAVLLAYVSAIQNYLYNPAATPEDLIRLFKYKMNNRKLKNEKVKDAAKKMLEQKIIDRIINGKLLDAIKAVELKIYDVQKLAIDAVSMRQLLMFYSIPKFNMDTSQMDEESPHFLRYFGSSGENNQCGFFSLGFASRDEAIEQILDNLQEPEILAMADSNLQFGSDDIKAVMDARLKSRGRDTKDVIDELLKKRIEDEKGSIRIRQKYISQLDKNKRSPDQIEILNASEAGLDKLVENRTEVFKGMIEKNLNKLMQKTKSYVIWYAKQKGIDTDPDIYKNDKEAKEKFLDGLFAEYEPECQTEYQKLIQEILVETGKIDKRFIEHKKRIGISDAVPDDRNHEVSILQRPYFREKAEIMTKLLRFIYPDEDLRETVRRSINDKLREGELEFDPNPNWSVQNFTYPQMLADLNNYNIYAWVTKHCFERMQTARGGHIASPVYETSDGEYVLVEYLSGGKHGKPVGLLNKGANHFEKWIDADDYPRLARAVRHQNLKGNDGLTKDTKPNKTTFPAAHNFSFGA